MERVKPRPSLSLIMVLLLGMTAATTEQPAGKPREVTFFDPVEIAGISFPPDTYRITEVMEEQDHVLVFVSTRAKKPRERRVKCQVKPLPARSTYSEQRFVEDSAGKRTITSLVFEGDDVEYVF